MKAEYINPFISEFQRIFKEVTGDDIALSKSFIKQGQESTDNVRVEFQVIGDIQGMVALELSMESAKAVASAMMGGMVLPEMEEMARSAISELGNMVTGNATGKIAEQGFKVDITPPKVTSEVAKSEQAPLGFLFSNPNKAVEMNISLKQS